jgi:hypothetical protein
MSKKSIVVGLPIVPFNQNKQSDVCKYLEYVQEFCTDIFKPEESRPDSEQVDCFAKLRNQERVLKEVNVPLCGDLLGRERVSGEKEQDWVAIFGLNVSKTSLKMWHSGIQSSLFLGYVI